MATVVLPCCCVTVPRSRGAGGSGHLASSALWDNRRGTGGAALALALAGTCPTKGGRLCFMEGGRIDIGGDRVAVAVIVAFCAICLCVIVIVVIVVVVIIF
eukprot:TRINITY_DN2245_c0_g1_i1.p5 TRINITY_DN2245_c0_g1~~TRINITY_DN2245_c0_g1_i1.p5  ORF type:complete len:101 (+),score=13.58 TRINITY_DN2245_c0_g1_i1:576-878(+)